MGENNISVADLVDEKNKVYAVGLPEKTKHDVEDVLDALNFRFEKARVVAFTHPLLDSEGGVAITQIDIEDLLGDERDQDIEQ